VTGEDLGLLNDLKVGGRSGRNLQGCRAGRSNGRSEVHCACHFAIYQHNYHQYVRKDSIFKPLRYSNSMCLPQKKPPRMEHLALSNNDEFSTGEYPA
jgi:hypothetical protein